MRFFSFVFKFFGSVIALSSPAFFMFVTFDGADISNILMVAVPFALFGFLTFFVGQRFSDQRMGIQFLGIFVSTLYVIFFVRSAYISFLEAGFISMSIYLALLCLFFIADLILMIRIRKNISHLLVRPKTPLVGPTYLSHNLENDK